MDQLKNYIMKHRVISKFVIAGSSAAGAQLLVLYILTDIFGMWYLFSAVCAFIVAVLVSFSSHKWWTFRDRHRESMHRQFTLYLAIQITNLILNIAFIYILVDILGVWYLVSQAIISLILAVVSFLLYKYKIFIHSIYLKTHETDH